MKSSNYSSGRNRHRIKIVAPEIRTPEEEQLWAEVRKYAQLVPSEPEPNMGRLDEIREEIQKGTYITKEVIEETAARIALRFMKQE